MSTMYRPENVIHTANRKFMVDRCGYCGSSNMKRRSCVDCGTTAPNVNPPDEKNHRNKKKAVNVSS